MLRVPMELFDSTVHWVDNDSNEPASTHTIAVIQTDTSVTLIITLMQVLSYKTYTEAKTETSCIPITHIIQLIRSFCNTIEPIISQIVNSCVRNWNTDASVISAAFKSPEVVKGRRDGGIPQRWSIPESQWINHQLLVSILSKNC